MRIKIALFYIDYLLKTLLRINIKIIDIGAINIANAYKNTNSAIFMKNIKITGKTKVVFPNKNEKA